VPKVTIILRKAYGGAYLAMCSRDMGADSVLAWPSAEIAVMGPEGAAGVLYKKELDKAEDRKALLQEKVAEYRKAHANPVPRRGGPAHRRHHPASVDPPAGHRAPRHPAHQTRPPTAEEARQHPAVTP